jgi:hypothetical protein
MVSSSLVLVTMLLAAGCGSEATVESAPCNPLAGGSCLLPWPSSYYLAEDQTTATGFRVRIPPEAMPVNIDGIPVDPAPFERNDGFSPSGVIIVGFSTGVSPDGLPPASDIGVSVGASSPIVLLNMDTGERVPFFAEVDQNQPEVEHRVLLIRPVIRMAPGSRHVVAIRNGVTAPGGGPLPISTFMQSMLDGGTGATPAEQVLAAGYPAIFTALEGAGVARTDLVLAWDFVTSSDESLMADMLAMREQALPALGDAAEGLTFTATEDPDATRPEALRFLRGTFQSPLFLDGDVDADASKIARDAAGKPMMNGFHDANFGAVIPRCVETTRPVPVIVFGHGLFGNGADSLDDGFLQEVANRHCVVFVAGDFLGLTNRNFAAVAFAVNDLNRGEAMVDKLGQGVIDFMALTRMVRGPMHDAPEFQYMGEPVIDPTRINYYGASLGGIMGNTFMAYEPTITRGALGVPGGSWSLLFERSIAWLPLQVAISGAYPDPMLAELITAFLGMALERFDPITTSARVVHDPIPGVPAKQIFMYEALGDCLVTHLSTEMVARTMGIPVTGPSLYVPFGMQEQLGEGTSGLTIYDEHPEYVPPATNIPPSEDNGTHGGVNKRDAVQRQVEAFLREGILRHECRVGDTLVPCDCSVAGACD